MSPEAKNPLDERRRALEDSFYGASHQAPLDRLQRQLGTSELKKALAEASGIRDDRVLNHLLAANIQGETITALGIVPLVAVAWSDGTLDEPERATILSSCDAEGISIGTVGYELMDSWLQTPPTDCLFSAWKDFVAEARHCLSGEALSAFRADILQRARRVAESSGGEANRISAAEQAVLDELDAAFQG